MAKIFTILLGWMILFSNLHTVSAADPIAGAAGMLIEHASPSAESQIDDRVVKIEAFLKKHNSPLVPHAKEFVIQADKHQLDWRLVVSIAGLESTFGKFIPYNSYNAWGWGIPTGQQSGIGFQDWEDGIATVSKGLKTRYVERGLTTPETMGPVYAASPTWATRVRYFMNKIDDQSTDLPDAISMNW